MIGPSKPELQRPGVHDAADRDSRFVQRRAHWQGYGQRGGGRIVPTRCAQAARRSLSTPMSAWPWVAARRHRPELPAKHDSRPIVDGRGEIVRRIDRSTAIGARNATGFDAQSSIGLPDRASRVCGRHRSRRKQLEGMNPSISGRRGTGTSAAKGAGMALNIDVDGMVWFLEGLLKRRARLETRAE